MSPARAPLPYTEPSLSGLSSSPRSAAKPADPGKPVLHSCFSFSSQGSTATPIPALDASRPTTAASTWSASNAQPSRTGTLYSCPASASLALPLSAADRASCGAELAGEAGSAPRQSGSRPKGETTPSFGVRRDDLPQFGLGDSAPAAAPSAREGGTQGVERDAQPQLLEFGGQVESTRRAMAEAKGTGAAWAHFEQMLLVAERSEQLVRGRDATLEAVLVELEGARSEVEHEQQASREREAEVQRLQTEMQEVQAASQQRVELASGNLKARALELDAVRSELREAQAASEQQQELLRARDAELASLRAELKEAQAAAAAAAAQPQSPPLPRPQPPPSLPPSLQQPPQQSSELLAARDAAESQLRAELEEERLGRGAPAPEQPGAAQEERLSQLEAALASSSSRCAELEEVNSRLRLDLQEAVGQGLRVGRMPFYLDSGSGGAAAAEVPEPAAGGPGDGGSALSPVRPRSARSHRLRQEVLGARAAKGGERGAVPVQEPQHPRAQREFSKHGRSLQRA